MEHLLEFKDYNERSFLQEVVVNVLFSEVEDSLKPVVYESVITINEDSITCHDLRKSDNNFEFRSYLVTINSRMEQEDFKMVSKRLEVYLSKEFDEPIKCVSLQNFPINEFVICNEKEFNILSSILEFESDLRDELYEFDSEYGSAIDLQEDTFEHNPVISIYIRKFLSKLGLMIVLRRDKLNESEITYKIDVKNFFCGNYNFITPIEITEDKTKIDSRVRTWIRDNLPVHYFALDKLKELQEKILQLNLSFTVDLDLDFDEESKRFYKMLQEKVLPLFATDETKQIGELLNQFNNLKDWNIDADWDHQGNYFYLFDITYKGNDYIFHVKYNLKTKQISIELKDKNIKEEVPVSEFCETIYLLVEEN
jgi:hypothetical protein